MFDLQLAFEIRSVNLDVKDVGGVLVRRCKVKLAREFDVLIARGIGGDALKILGSVKSGALEKAVIPITAINVSAEMWAGQRRGIYVVTIDRFAGRKAVATAPKEPEEPPMIELEFACAYEDEVWTFLGRNGGGMADVVFTPTQRDLFESMAKESRERPDQLVKAVEVIKNPGGGTVVTFTAKNGEESLIAQPDPRQLAVEDVVAAKAKAAAEKLPELVREVEQLIIEAPVPAENFVVTAAQVTVAGKTYNVEVLHDEVAGYTVTCAAVAGAIGQGDTREEALAQLIEVIEVMAEEESEEEPETEKGLAF